MVASRYGIRPNAVENVFTKRQIELSYYLVKRDDYRYLEAQRRAIRAALIDVLVSK